MGKGGRANVNISKSEEGWKSPYNPLDPKAPKLPSKGELKAVIPKECFERSYGHSMWFVLRDTLMAAALVYATNATLSTEVPTNLLGLEGLTWFVGWNMKWTWEYL